MQKRDILCAGVLQGFRVGKTLLEIVAIFQYCTFQIKLKYHYYTDMKRRDILCAGVQEGDEVVQTFLDIVDIFYFLN